MPRKDPEKAREYQLRYAADNAERKREAARQWRRDNPERSLQSRRDYVQAHREEVLEDSRRRYQANPDQANEGRRRRYRASGGDKRDLQRRKIVAVLWSEQGELCYLCEEPVPLKDAVLEHDHRCCPLGDFCTFCIRGASHQECNKAIGHAADDPERLERMARNLRAKLAEVEERLASKPIQDFLDVVT